MDVLSRPRLSVLAQTYVAMVASLAVISTVTEDHVWFVALVVLSLPLSLLALWVGFYAGLAAGFVVGHDSTHLPWVVALVWVAVWTTTAWLNAHVAEKIVHRGWAALRVGPRTFDDEDEDLY
jgi:thiamine transporter ThiT